MDVLSAVEEERKLNELQDLHESIALDDAYFTCRNLTGKGRVVVPTAKQRRDVQTQASLLRFSSLASTPTRRRSASEDLTTMDAEDRLLAELDLTAKPRTFIASGSLKLYDPDKLLRRSQRRHVFVFSDIFVVASQKDSQDKYDVQQVFYVKDLRLRHSDSANEEDRLAFDIIVAKTRNRPLTELRFLCEDDSSWKQWIEDLENTLLAYHRQTEIAKQLGWFHDIIQGNIYSAAYSGDLQLLRKHIRRLDDPASDSRKKGSPVPSSPGTTTNALDSPDASGMTALHWAVIRGHEMSVRYLLDRGAEVDVLQKGLNTPLLLAAASGYENIARLLIERGADLNTLNHRGYDAVFMAVLCGHAAKGLPWLLQLLHTKGMDLNRFDRSGATPLHLCAERNLARPVRMLVDAGADVNARHARTQLTPLQMACSSKHPDVETIRSFLDKGAYPNWKDLSGRTAFDLALRSLPTQSSSSAPQMATPPPPPSAVVFSPSAVDINEVLLSPGSKRAPAGEDEAQQTPLQTPTHSVDVSSPAPTHERWRAMEATLQVVGDWVVRTLPALLELSKKGARFDPSSLQALRPSVRAAVLEAKDVWDKKVQPENFLAFVRTREGAGEDLRLHRNGWEKDDKASVCQLCSDAFNLTNRRHHCRACGVLCCDKCSSKRMQLTLKEPASGSRSGSLNGSFSGGSGSGKEKKREAEVNERVCDGCFNRLLHEASLPSLDHFRIRQLKKCAQDVIACVEQFVEELDSVESDGQTAMLARELFAINIGGVQSPITPRGAAAASSASAATTPLGGNQPRAPTRAASISSPPPSQASHASEDEAVVALLKARQARLLNVEHIVAKFLEASEEYHKINKKLIEQKIENNRLWGGR